MPSYRALGRTPPPGQTLDDIVPGSYDQVPKGMQMVPSSGPWRTRTDDALPSTDPGWSGWGDRASHLPHPQVTRPPSVRERIISGMENVFPEGRPSAPGSRLNDIIAAIGEFLGGNPPGKVDEMRAHDASRGGPSRRGYLPWAEPQFPLQGFSMHPGPRPGAPWPWSERSAHMGLTQFPPPLTPPTHAPARAVPVEEAQAAMQTRRAGVRRRPAGGYTPQISDRDLERIIEQERRLPRSGPRTSGSTRFIRR